MYTVLLQRDSRNEVCLQRINAYLRQEFDYELDHQEQVYLLIHLTKIVGQVDEQIDLLLMIQLVIRSRSICSST